MTNAHDLDGSGHTIHQATNGTFTTGTGPVESCTLFMSAMTVPQPEPPDGHEPADPWCECGETFDDRSDAIDHLREAIRDADR